jgi:hypothetical protein
VVDLGDGAPAPAPADDLNAEGEPFEVTLAPPAARGGVWAAIAGAAGRTLNAVRSAYGRKAA